MLDYYKQAIDLSKNDCAKSIDARCIQYIAGIRSK